MNPTIQKALDSFDEKFYEGDSNSVHCREHKTYATPSEIKSFLLHHLEEAVRETRDDLAQQLKDLVETQKKSAVDEYMRGLANGLICALACIEDKDPMYLEARSLDERSKKEN